MKDSFGYPSFIERKMLNKGFIQLTSTFKTVIVNILYVRNPEINGREKHDYLSR